MRRAALVTAAAMLLASPAGADELFELAKKVANPARGPGHRALPLQLGSGGSAPTKKGTSNYVRFQPVLPLHSIERLERHHPPVHADHRAAGRQPRIRHTDSGSRALTSASFLSPTGPLARGLTVGSRPRRRLSRQPNPRSARRSGVLGPTAADRVAARTVDLRPADASALVGRGQRPRGRYQRDLHSAVHKLHHPGCLDVRHQQRVLLLLDRQRGLRADQSYRRPSSFGSAAPPSASARAFATG